MARAQRGGHESATSVVYNPCCGVTCEAIPNALASGSAITPTVSPDNRSLREHFSYPSRRHKIDFGTNCCSAEARTLEPPLALGNLTV